MSATGGRDSRSIADLIAEDLTRHFGPLAVFFDYNTLEIGSEWPTAIRSAVSASSLTLAVMGPQWLAAADEFGRRMIDMPQDWVRQEIALSLQNKIPVIPVLVEGLKTLPPAEAFPPALASFAVTQSPAPIRPECWRSDVEALVREVRNKLRWFEEPRSSPTPIQNGRALLSETEINKTLEQLPGWRIASKRDDRAIEGCRVDLFRRYEFNRFVDAVEFMAGFAGEIERAPLHEQHHPLWRNDWKSVLVWYTTWDVGYRLTDLNSAAAALMDAYYHRLPQT